MGNDWTFTVTDMGKVLVFLGGTIVIVGLALILLGRTNLPLGRLPGDIVYRGKNTIFYFPLATSILLSVVLSILLYVIGRLRR
jgi:H+/Cl- antiporter ClcA